METNERTGLIERIKDDMRKRGEIRKALVNVINTYHCDMSEWQTFDTHAECYTELQMIEMIAAKLTALLQAAGEPDATSKIVSNRIVTRPHVFEIGDDVETNDGICGHIEDFQDATVIIRTDNELLIQRSIADIEYTGDADAAEEAK